MCNTRTGMTSITAVSSIRLDDIKANVYLAASEQSPHVSVEMQRLGGVACLWPPLSRL